MINLKNKTAIITGASRGIVLNGREDLGIPIIGLVAAGQPILAKENIEDKVDIPKEIFGQQADFLLRVKGDSMINKGIHDVNNDDSRTTRGHDSKWIDRTAQNFKIFCER